MRPIENWIWLPRERFPKMQLCAVNAFDPPMEGAFSVCEFTRRYDLNAPLQRLDLRFSGDTAFRLYINGKLLACGPASVGGDFFGNELPRPNFYSYRMTVSDPDILHAGYLDLRAEVRLSPQKLFEFSKGHGGFMLTAKALMEDETVQILVTDETWQCRPLPAYDGECSFNGKAALDDPIAANSAFTNSAFANSAFAEVISDLWHSEDVPIPPSDEDDVELSIPELRNIPAGQTVSATLTLPRIWPGYLCASASFGDSDANSDVTAEAAFFETDEEISQEKIILTPQSADYRGFTLHSVGGVRVTVENHSPSPVSLSLSLKAPHFPVSAFARTIVSDEGFNKLLDICAHSLKYCRQTLHLDSPKHCEPLACTGDYYIETLMTAFTFGDMRLSSFDLLRTAELLRHHDGRMFHTTYSLIFVQMLWDVYLLTGDLSLLQNCEDALTLLLHRFAGYLGENGLIETPPDYMFIDWLNPDDINTHHPPKALGQTCLCLFYYGALKTAARIYQELGMKAMADRQLIDADRLKEAILAQLYDPKRQLFFEGLNTPTDEKLLGKWMPQNVEKRYYRRHANILAAYFGILPKADCQALLRRIFPEDSPISISSLSDNLGEVQPYFMHFWLEAIYRNGLRKEQTVPLLSLWKEALALCDKGLPEGFYKPTPTYAFDYSHAWGGTPAYALPLALSGFSILEPGCRRIHLDPDLLGFADARVEIPAPSGLIVIEMKKGDEPVITLPDHILLE